MNKKLNRPFVFVLITTIVVLFLVAFVLINQTGFYSIPIINTVSEPQENNNASSGAISDTLLDINTATAEDFANFKNISKPLSKKIITFREQIGGFKSVDELLKVPDMTDEIFDSINFFMIVK